MRFLVNKTVGTEAEAITLLLQPRDKLAVDIETVSLDNRLPLGIAVALSNDLAFYFFNPSDELVKQVVEQTPLCLMHNAAFDIPILNKLGVQVPHFEDTYMLSYAAGVLENNLPALSDSILHKPCPSVTSLWKKKDQGNIAINHVKLGGMSMIHACNTYALWTSIPRVSLYDDIDRPCVDLVGGRVNKGILIDQHKLTEVEWEVMVRVEKLEAELRAELGDINLASNPQVADALRTKGIIGTRKTQSGADAVSEESLKPLHHPLADKILGHRSLMKTLTTYLPALRKADTTGKVHTNFGYTNTGRWSSSNPNLQNLTNDSKFDEDSVG